MPWFLKILSVKKVKIIKNKQNIPDIMANIELPYLCLNKASLFSYIISVSKAIPMKFQLEIPLW